MKKHLKKGVLLLIGVCVVTVFVSFDLHHFLTIEYLRQSENSLRQFQDHHPYLLILLYFASYLVIASFALPGALVATLAGGFLFGLAKGVVLVSFASTIGATAAFLVARYVLRDWIQKRYGGKLHVINEGIENEGGFYLFTMRLIPVFPFFLINVVMGLTRMKVTTFYWVSQLGMFPATLVFVNAGKELGKIESLSGIVSPGLIASFAALGLLPLAARKAVDYLRRKTILKGSDDGSI